MPIIRLIGKLARDTRGAQSIELAFLCVMIVVAIIASVKGLGDENTGMWAMVSSRSVEAMQQ